MSPLDSLHGDSLHEDALRDAFEALAGTAPAPSRTDLEAARLAWGPPRESLWRKGFAGVRRYRWVAVPALVAVACLAALAVLAGVGSVRLTDPAPATSPSGPGALPATIFTPPPGTPFIGDAPISRAAYAFSSIDGETGWRMGVVGADGGEYRLLPYGLGRGFALSADGRVAAWLLEGEPYRDAVVVCELPTGRTREVLLHGRPGKGLSVQRLALSPTGDRALVLGRETFDETLGFSAGYLVDLRTGEQRLFTRFADGLAWTAAGRPVLSVAADLPGGGGTLPPGAVTAPPRPSGEEQSYLGAVFPPALLAGLVVSPGGATRYDLRSGATPTSQNLTDWRLEVTGQTPVSVPLGSSRFTSLLAALPDDRAIVMQWDPAAGAQESRYTEFVRLVQADATVRTIGRTAHRDVDVVAVATDVAAVGGVVEGIEPHYGAGDLSWWSWYARRILGAIPGPVYLVGAVLIGVPLLRTPVRRLRRGSGRGRVGRGRGRVGRGRVAAAALAVAGLGLAAAPAVSDTAWLSSAPRPTADAPPVRPEELRDQTLVPFRAFDVTGTPRTHAVTTVWSGRVAGRDGWYGTDAGTARIVRLDDVPGLPRLDPGGNELRTGADLRISENGRAVLAMTRAGRYVVRLDRATATPVDRLPDGVTPDTPLAVADDGTLLADPDPAVSRRSSSVLAMNGTRVELDVGSVRGGPVASWGSPVQAVPPAPVPWWGLFGWPGWRVAGALLSAVALGAGWLVPLARRLRTRSRQA